MNMYGCCELHHVTTETMTPALQLKDWSLTRRKPNGLKFKTSKTSLRPWGGVHYFCHGLMREICEENVPVNEPLSWTDGFCFLQIRLFFLTNTDGTYCFWLNALMNPFNDHIFMSPSCWCFINIKCKWMFINVWIYTKGTAYKPYQNSQIQIFI